MNKLKLTLVLLFLFLLAGCTKSYTVTFVPNNGETMEAKIVENKGLLEVPTVTKEGYEFGGWFIDSAFQTRFSAKDPIESDLTLYANWNILLFTVTFVNHDDTVIVVRENVPYNTAATAPTDPIREGYSFTGWDQGFSSVKSNLTVKAQFDILTYEVVFYNQANEPIGQAQTIEHGSSATAPNNPTKEGYAFTSWDKEFDEVTSNLQIYPQFERLQYTVEFQDSDGIRIGEVQNVYYGESATAPSAPTKTGFTFVNWDQDITSIKQNLVVMPNYQIDEYAIFYYDGSTLLTHQPNNYTIESGFALVEYVKTAFYFVGWYEDSAFTKKVESIIPGNTGPVSFYGKWLDTTQTFSLNYELNGGDWTWTTGTVAAPANGIDAYSNLPEQLMADFYYYLKQNNLLTSPLVASKLQKTTWDTFKANYTDPVAIYNHTSTNTSSMNDGYSQFFYSTATGDTATHQVLTLTGGFFGTEPYKTKYANLISHLSLLLFLKGYNTEFWSGASSKSLAGFVLDGYFYGTQGAGTGDFALLRAKISNTNVKLILSGGSVTEQATAYAITSYNQGSTAKLVAPIRDGYVFAGWYDNASFTGQPVLQVAAGVAPASMYYAKWIAYTELE